MTPDMEAVILSKLTEVAQQQATAAQSQAVSAERMVGVLERMEGELERGHEERRFYNEASQDRSQGVISAVTQFMDKKMDASEGWWRRTMVLIAICNLLLVAMKVLDLVGGHK